MMILGKLDARVEVNITFKTRRAAPTALNVA